MVVLAACPGGNRSIGESCSTLSDCASGLQCLDHTCVPACRRHADCGDGLECVNGSCYASAGPLGSACDREVDCAVGLACHLETTDIDSDGLLSATCGNDNAGGVLDTLCTVDTDCRNGTCALGRCVDICAVDTDCPIGHVCTSIPRVTSLTAAAVPSFFGCLPDHGSITYELPTASPQSDTWLPVPGNARSVALVMTVADATQLVGAKLIHDPEGAQLYAYPGTLAEYYANPLRHAPAPGISVLTIPSSSAVPLRPGGYFMTLGSFRANGSPASDTPRALVVAKLDTGTILDVHFHFVDLAEHPCAAAFDGGILDATSAATSPTFQNQFVASLRSILARGGVAVGAITYDDVTGHPDLDGLEVRNLGALLELSTQPGGIHVFLVRTLSPAGMLTAVGGTPGTPGIAGTAASGIAVSLDGLCYRSWEEMARVTAHATARHLGLFRNKEPDGALDQIDDSDDQATNLMYYSEFGGTDLSDGQREILMRSPVLR
ncbi:MAG: hypothetical protein K8W52_32145 [Deltaproteobacteria bacterium]|nr:hypothetical protein [Deltaproteobacteria bacterium]